MSVPLQQEENIEDIVYYFAISLFGQNTEYEILWDLAKNCISKLGFEDCVIYLINEKKGVLEQRAAYGPKNPKDFTIHHPIDIPIGKGIVGSVALTGKPEVIRDTSKDSRYIQDDAFRYSEIAVPIILEGKVIGVIDSEHSNKNFFSDRHLKILRLSAALCANKLIRARAEEERRNNEQILLQAQQKLSELSLKALRAQMNPHFIFNALNSIQHFITEGQSSEALRYLSVFGRFIRRILDSSNRFHISIADEMEILESYLKLEKMRFGSLFEFEISVSPGVDIYNDEIPVLLIQPFVEKAMSEGISNSRRQGSLSIHFDKNGTDVRCTIQNASISSTPAEQGYLSRPNFFPAQPGWGIQERIDLIDRLFHTRIQVGVSGTQIEIKVPIQQEESDLKLHES